MSKRIKIILATISILVGLVFGSFYLFIVSGVFPKIQELWVTTAMTTLSHKWLATSFISEDVIQEIMDRTYVDDSEYNSNAELVVSQLPTTYPLARIEVGACSLSTRGATLC